MPPSERRQYMVIKRRERPELTHIHGKRFGTRNAFLISDRKEAQDIDQRYGHAAPRHTLDAESVLVLPIADRRPQRREGYRVAFQVPELPWKTPVPAPPQTVGPKGRDNGHNGLGTDGGAGEDESDAQTKTQARRRRTARRRRHRVVAG